MKRMDINQRICLNVSTKPVGRVISYKSKKITAYFVYPLTLVHLARAPAAVTHSMTEW